MRALATLIQDAILCIEQHDDREGNSAILDEARVSLEEALNRLKEDIEKLTL